MTTRRSDLRKIGGFALLVGGCFGNAVYDNVYPSMTTAGDEVTSPGATETSGDPSGAGGLSFPVVDLGDGETGSSTTAGEPPPPCGEPGSQERIMFMTTRGVSGHFGSGYNPPWDWNGIHGRARGDALCNCSAARRGYPGTYRAWLSDDEQGAAQAFGLVNEDLPSHFVRPEGACIAESWADLRMGRLVTPISDAQVQVWTGTSAEGERVENGTCGNWDTKERVGTYGLANLGGTVWSYCVKCGEMGCDRVRNLYCVQVSHEGSPPIPSVCFDWFE